MFVELNNALKYVLHVHVIYLSTVFQIKNDHADINSLFDFIHWLCSAAINLISCTQIKNHQRCALCITCVSSQIMRIHAAATATHISMIIKHSNRFQTGNG